MKNILKLPATSSKSGKSRSSIYQGVKEGTFPAPIKIGERAVGWLEDEIDDWLAKRISASRGGAE
jgi:prophage regulatory protein